MVEKTKHENSNFVYLLCLDSESDIHYDSSYPACTTQKVYGVCEYYTY